MKDICNELEVRELCHKILQNVSILLDADRGSLFLVQGAKSDKPSTENQNGRWEGLFAFGFSWNSVQPKGGIFAENLSSDSTDSFLRRTYPKSRPIRCIYNPVFTFFVLIGLFQVLSSDTFCSFFVPLVEYWLCYWYFQNRPEFRTYCDKNWNVVKKVGRTNL